MWIESIFSENLRSPLKYLVLGNQFDVRQIANSDSSGFRRTRWDWWHLRAEGKHFHGLPSPHLGHLSR